MSGTHLTDHQIRLDMSKRKHQTQEAAAAMAGFSERTARRIDQGVRQPAHKAPRTWRTRPDPFADVWENELVPLLRAAPQLKAITLLGKLQEAHPDRFPYSLRRTLERRVSQWRAQHGPEKEIFFPQEHLPGLRGLSDFTDMNKLRVTLAGAPFDHRLCHFVLAFSHWEYACVVEGGESFEALSEGLQNALWQAGGCPCEHRTDSLSAAFKNLQPQEDFTGRYRALLEHHGMRGTRNNGGLAHENGSVESSHRPLKDAVDQALMLRGHRDFEDRAAYEQFVREAVPRRNRRNAAAFNAEREHLQALPWQRTPGFVEEEARVTRCSTFTVRGVLYSAPSRLIGQRLKGCLYAERLDCYLSGALAYRTIRRKRTDAKRLRVLDYRHFIDALKRKPQAFGHRVFRDDLFPRGACRRAWEELDARLSPRQACKTMVGLLELAARHGVEATLAERLDATLAAGRLPDIERWRAEIAPPAVPCPQVSVVIPALTLHDRLLEEEAAA
jgi:hypothetical protein